MTEAELKKELAAFLDENGRLTRFPTKRKKQIYALFYLAPKIEKGKSYTEKEINEILEGLHTFSDCCLLRRDLCDCGFMRRERNGSAYTMNEVFPTQEELIR